MDSNSRSRENIGAIGLIVGILLTIVGCELSVTVDVPEQEPTYVLNSIFTPDSVWKVNLSKSRSAIDEEPFTRIDDALVVILDENNTIVETLKSKGNGNYQGSTRPQLSKTYKVQASINTETILKSFNAIPVPVPITSAELNGVDFKLMFDDPTGIRNFYVIKVVKEEKRVIRKSATASDTVVVIREDFMDPNDPSLEYGYFETTIMLNDRIFDGQSFLFKAKIANPPDTRVYLFSVSEEYYNYYMQIGLQKKNKGDAFAQPVQVISNIENGWGVFGGYSFSTKSLK